MSRHLGLDDLARLPLPGMNVPASVAFAPDGRSVTYLLSADDSLVRSLWRHDLVTGARSVLASPLPETSSEAALSREEHLRHERTRTSELGVTDYAWATAASEATLLVPMAGRLFVTVGAETEREVHPLTGVAHASDAHLSPDGRLISFCSGGDLYLVPVRGGSPMRLTDDGGPGISNGVADFVAAEELDRLDGTWWSADSRSIVYAHVDERRVPPWTIAEPGRADPAGEVQRYPFAGGPNAEVTLRVAAVEGTGSHEVRLEMEPDDYLGRVVVHPAGGWLVAVLPRAQSSLTWHRVGADGSAHVLWREEAEPWINLDADTRILADGRILRSSERSGFRHLELRAANGDLLRVLTGGDWVVTRVVAVAEARREVLFVATRDGVLERHLYAVPLDADQPVNDPERLTTEPGWHEIVASPDGERWVDTWSDLETAPSVAVAARDAAPVAIHASAVTAATEQLDPPDLVDVLAADGRTVLHAAMYRAHTGRAGGTPPPGVIWVYGGPHSQYVKRAWEMTVHPLRQFLAQSGATVALVDNRGTACRGVAFEAILDGRLGWTEVADQAAAVRQFADRGELDPAKVGITGWSYGGFMTVLAMVREPTLFRVGVAGAPVTEWTGYDTAYTERYLGMPAENPNGYRDSTLLSHAAGLSGDLLLIHGTLDDNVHFRQSERLLAALQAAGREIELVPLPGQRHRTRGADAIRLREQRTAAYLLRGLGLPVPTELG